MRATVSALIVAAAAWYEGSQPGRSGVVAVSDRGQSGARPGSDTYLEATQGVSDRGQTGVRHQSDKSRGRVGVESEAKKEAKEAKKKGKDVNAAEADGTTALHWASYRDDIDSADLLIRAGAKVNAATDLGVTPLWNASLNGSAAMVRRLLDAGANPNAPLLAGETPLMVAARGGHRAVVEQLIGKGASPNARGARGQTALMWAIAQKHPDVVKVLLAHGADVHARSEVWSQVMAVPPHGYLDYNRAIPHGGDTALMFAARAGDLASAKLLVDAHADVNDRDAWGVTATALAAHSGYTDLVSFLLERGADPNPSEAGFAALHAAVMRRDEKMVAALLAHGADANAPVRNWTPTRRSSKDFHFPPELVGATPFWLAARFAEPAVMRLLVKHGADPLFVHHGDHVVDGKAGTQFQHRQDVTTAVMAAVGMGGGQAWIAPPDDQKETLVLEAVRIAVELGVDVQAKNVDGRTALDAARTQKYDSVVKYLTAKGASAAPTQPRTEPRPLEKKTNPFEGQAVAISNGSAMFRTRCAGCHGPDARGYLGPDLTGYWSGGGTDDRMFEIVRRGVPGTEMVGADPVRVPDKEIWMVLAYLRTLNAVPAAAATGDAANGERVFRTNCSSCHMVNGRGGQLGPDLSRIGSGRPRPGLLAKLRGASEFIRPGYEPVTLVTRDGERINGIKKNEDEFSIQIMDTRERLQGYLKASLAEFTIGKKSLMPVYGPDRLNDRDLDDLLRYLTGLRSGDAPRK